MRERILRIAGGEHEELRVEALERLLELLAPGDLEDELDTGGGLEILVAGADDARVAGHAGRGENGQRGGRADRVDLAVGEQRLRPVRLGRLRLIWSVHGNDERDPVALGDGLAQTSRAGHSRAL